jgi:hypothetical protein
MTMTRTGKTKRIAGVLLVLVLAAIASEAVAIVVAPTAVYLTDENPSAAISLYNPSTVAEEVEVAAIFGYPTTDEAGNVMLHLDEEGVDPRSSASWIQILPRRLVVPPGQRRVVRLLGRPPVGAGDGEYWTRLVLTSRGQRLPVSGATDSSQVQVGMDLEVRTLIALTFRKGDVTTGVEVEEFAPQVVGDSILIRPRLVRQGDAAFIGLMELTLTDTTGMVVREWTEQVAVYRAYHRRYRYDIGDVAPGRYLMSLRLSTERDDVPVEDRLPAPVVERAVELVVP